jgi:hypothetical protein
MSLESLQMELKGFGGAVAVRYASWPQGCSVRIATDALARDEGGSNIMDTAPSSLQGKFVSYDATARTIEVCLKDGSSRVVPAKFVTRAYRAMRTATASTRTPGGIVAESPGAASHSDGPRRAAAASHLDEPPQPQQREHLSLNIENLPAPSKEVKEVKSKPVTFGKPQLNPELLV